MYKLNTKYWLEKFGSFLMDGIDSKRFLNGITTSNIISIDTDIKKTCWLTPSGNLRALLEIHSYINDSNKFLILVLIGNVGEFRNYCNSLIFPSDEVSVSEVFDSYRLQEIHATSSWRDYKPSLLSEEQQEIYSKKNELNLLNPDDLRDWKISQSIPNLNKEVDGKNNPLELGLSDLIDFNKGCYLGQETMAKLKNVSSLKQEIRVWSSQKKSRNIQLNDKKVFINDKNEKVAGFITSFLELKDHSFKGLVMIKRKYLKKYSTLYSDELGPLKINKSNGSIFL